MHFFGIVIRFDRRIHWLIQKQWNRRRLSSIIMNVFFCVSIIFLLCIFVAMNNFNMYSFWAHLLQQIRFYFEFFHLKALVLCCFCPNWLFCCITEKQATTVVGNWSEQLYWIFFFIVFSLFFSPLFLSVLFFGFQLFHWNKQMRHSGRTTTMEQKKP